jgi:hypothetical protein
MRERLTELYELEAAGISRRNICQAMGISDLELSALKRKRYGTEPGCPFNLNQGEDMQTRLAAYNEQRKRWLELEKQRVILIRLCSITSTIVQREYSKLEELAKTLTTEEQQQVIAEGE